MSRLLPALIITLVPAPLLADTPAATAPADASVSTTAPANTAKSDDDATPTVNDNTRYGGVVPGGPNLPPRLPRAGKRGEPRITWLGFKMVKEVPTVFVELTEPVAWSVDEKPGALTYTLQGATIPLSNNRRPLDVSAFGTAIKSVVAERRGHDVQLVITSDSATPIHHERNEDAGHGLKFLLVELPAK